MLTSSPSASQYLWWGIHTQLAFTGDGGCQKKEKWIRANPGHGTNNPDSADGLRLA